MNTRANDNLIHTLSNICAGPPGRDIERCLSVGPKSGIIRSTSVHKKNNFVKLYLSHFQTLSLGFKIVLFLCYASTLFISSKNIAIVSITSKQHPGRESHLGAVTRMTEAYNRAVNFSNGLYNQTSQVLNFCGL